jgi:hypothetical protein
LLFVTGPTGLQALTCLLAKDDYPEYASEPHVNHVNSYPWLLSLHSLTSLWLFTVWKDPQQLQQGIADLAQQLPQLHNLTLLDMNISHYRDITWQQLAPLTACTLLTRLALDGYVLCEPAAAAAAGGAHAIPTQAGGVAHPQLAAQHAGWWPVQQAGQAQQAAFNLQDDDFVDVPDDALAGMNPLEFQQAVQSLHALSIADAAASRVPTWRPTPLPALRELFISSLGCAVWRCPLSRLAPNLTRLQQVSMRACLSHCLISTHALNGLLSGCDYNSVSQTCLAMPHAFCTPRASAAPALMLSQTLFWALLPQG